MEDDVDLLNLDDGGGKAQIPSSTKAIPVNPDSNSQMGKERLAPGDDLDEGIQACPNSLYGCAFVGSDREVDLHLSGGLCEKQILRERVTKKEVELNQLREELRSKEDELFILKRELWGSDYDPSIDYGTNRGEFRVYGEGESEYPRRANAQGGDEVPMTEKLQRSLTWGTEWFSSKINTVKNSEAFHVAKEKTNTTFRALDEKLGEIQQSETYRNAKMRASEAASAVGEAAQKGTERVKDYVQQRRSSSTVSYSGTPGSVAGYGATTAYKYET